MRRFALCALVIIFIASISSCKRGSPIDALRSNRSTSMIKALAARGTDELPGRLVDLHRTRLTGRVLPSISSVVTLADNSLVLLSPIDRSVMHFDQNGHYLSTFGSIGLGPGQYQMPAGITRFHDDIAIVDFVAHRLTIVKPNGTLDSSFVYSRQQFSASQIGYSPRANTFFLFGNKWLPSNSGVRQADLLDFYDPAGNYLTSTLAMPREFAALNLFGSDQAFISRNDADGTSTFSLPFIYGQYVLGSEQSYTFTKLQAPNTFRQPSELLEESEPKDRQVKYDAWLSRWTPIVASWRRGGYAYIEYQTFNPLRYTIDIWGSSSSTPLSSVHTNFKYVAATGFVDMYVNDVKGDGEQVELLTGELK